MVGCEKYGDGAGGKMAEAENCSGECGGGLLVDITAAQRRDRAGVC